LLSRAFCRMANLDGSGRRVVIKDSKQVPHVFGMFVFDDMMFWSDWTNRGLLFAHKMRGDNVSMLVGTVMPPYSVKVFHGAVQKPGPNVCEATKCEHLCVPKHDGSGSKCLCADGFKMREDGSCSAECAKHEFLCPRPDQKYDFACNTSSFTAAVFLHSH
uniref:EGF-like domain-containing protein n=1 Tax=Gongylonema pulchrum TaxID=637853 RepID=A0A183E367_9BILA